MSIKIQTVQYMPNFWKMLQTTRLSIDKYTEKKDIYIVEDEGD